MNDITYQEINLTRKMYVFQDLYLKNALFTSMDWIDTIKR